MRDFKRLENNFENVVLIGEFKGKVLQSHCKESDKKIDKLFTSGAVSKRFEKFTYGYTSDEACRYYYFTIMSKLKNDDYRMKGNYTLNHFPMTLKLLGKILTAIKNPDFIRLAAAMEIVNGESFHDNVLYLRYLKNIFPDGLYIPLNEYDTVISPSDYTLYIIPEEPGCSQQTDEKGDDKIEQETVDDGDTQDTKK